MQNYEVLGIISGFNDTKNLKLNEIDDFFSTIQDVDNKDISFTLANPYVLREYSFDVTNDVKEALDMREDSKISVHNIVVLQKPIENSTINFLAPVLINTDNNKIIQITLDPRRHPDFGMAESIKSFRV